METFKFEELTTRGKQAALKRYLTTDAIGERRLNSTRTPGYALITWKDALEELTADLQTWLFTEHGERIA